MRKMASWLVLCTILIHACHCITALEDSQNVPNDVLTACNETLREEACDYGRRFYRLSVHTVGNNETASDCQSSCSASYTQEDAVASCFVGCKLESEINTGRDELMSYEANGADLIRHAQMDQLMSHWMFEMLAGFDLFNDWYDSGNDDSSPEVSTYVVVEQSNNQLHISSYQIISSSKQSLRPVAGTETMEESSLLSGNVYSDSDDSDFEPCLSISEYSRLILCLLLMSSGLVLLWLSCTTVTTAPKHKITSKKETIPKQTMMHHEFFVSEKVASVHKGKLDSAADDDVALIQV